MITVVIITIISITIQLIIMIIIMMIIMITTITVVIIAIVIIVVIVIVLHITATILIMNTIIVSGHSFGRQACTVQTKTTSPVRLLRVWISEGLTQANS